MSGSLVVVGTGPGKAELMTPATQAALARATDLVGYGPYLDRVSTRADQCRHASDNRVELERARLALTLAAAGRQVAVVSGGDPGVFAMAAAIFEAVEAGDPAWRDLPAGRRRPRPDPAGPARFSWRQRRRRGPCHGPRRDAGHRSDPSTHRCARCRHDPQTRRYARRRHDP